MSRLSKITGVRGLVLRLLIAVSSTVLFVAILEGGTRLVWYEANNGGFCTVTDEVFGHTNAPNCAYTHKKTENMAAVAYRMNDCGFRDPLPCGAYHADTPLVFAIGDSFTFGSMVDEPQTYVRVSERMLRSSGQPITYVNAGVGGWDLYQYEHQLTRILARRPAIVTVAVLPNDLFADLSQRGLQERERLTRERDAEGSFDRSYQIQRPLAERLATEVAGHSRLFDYLTHAMLSRDSVYASLYERRTEDSYLRRDYSTDWSAKIHDAAEILRRMAARAGRQGCKLALIHIPQRIQALVASRPDQFPHLDAGAFGARLAAVAADAGIEFIDFLPAVASQPRPTNLYFPVDGHLTAQGHDALAVIVAAKLKELLSK